jgi:CubicO group peptidase (beta-lactamase class C family)
LIRACDPLDDYAAELLESGMAPAFAVAVTDERGTLTYGDARPDELWPVASIGRSFTAAIALQLADAGPLDLHAPVTTSVPWLPLGAVTPHQLLTHTSGLVGSSERAPASNWDGSRSASRRPASSPAWRRRRR